MTTRVLILIGAITLLTACPESIGSSPLGTAFTYQGHLKDGGSPANAAYDFQFDLYDGEDVLANHIAGPLYFPDVQVTDGLFTLELDFGSHFNGDERWLEIALRTAGKLAYLEPLSGRQRLAAAPYAQHAVKAALATTATTVPWSAITDVPTNIGNVYSPWESTVGATLAWGWNADGQLNVPSGKLVELAAGGFHSLAIRDDGTLAGWGRNSSGQSSVPSGAFIAIAAGVIHSLGLRADGTLEGWGDNEYGQVDVPAGTFTAISAKAWHSLAIRSDGALVGWGRNDQGQINVPEGTFTAVSAGHGHGLAIRGDGTLVGWGNNSNGQIDVPDGTFSAVEAGFSFSLALRTDGTLVAWGSNSSGQLNVPEGTFTSIAAGTSFGYAIRTDGVLFGWGLNNFGQAIVPDGRFTKASAGHFHGLAISDKASSLVDISVEGELHVSGRLGIGTSEPTTSLHVAGGIRARGGAPGIGGNNNNGYAFSGNSGDNDSGMFSMGDGQVSLYTNGQERFRVNSDGNVGIGRNSVGYRLDVFRGAVDGNVAGFTSSNSFGSIVAIANTDTGGHNYSFISTGSTGPGGAGNLVIRDVTAGGNDRLILSDTGNVGIGTMTPSQRLHVAGNICATGTIGVCSDARFKEHVEPVSGALEKVDRLRGVAFDWKREAFPDHQFAEDRQLGFIAQEVVEVLPQVVSRGEDGYLSVDYGRLTPLLVEAIKELRKENQRLQTEKDRQLALRDAELDTLRAEIQELKAQFYMFTTKKEQ